MQLVEGLVGDPQRLRGYRQAGIDRRRRRKERRIHDEQVRDVVRSAQRIENRTGGVSSEPEGPALVGIGLDTEFLGEDQRVSGPTSRTVGENLARLRARVGMTTRVLAASLAENGLPMSSSGITDIERGRRSVSVDQLTALAAALGISPITLLTPIPDDESPDTEVVLSGTSPERASDMHLWLRGDRSLTDDLLDDFEREAFRRLANPPWTWKKETTDGR